MYFLCFSYQTVITFVHNNNRLVFIVNTQWVLWSRNCSCVRDLDCFYLQFFNMVKALGRNTFMKLRCRNVLLYTKSQLQLK